MGLLQASPGWSFLSSGPYWDRSRRCAAIGADSQTLLFLQFTTAGFA